MRYRRPKGIPDTWWAIVGEAHCSRIAIVSHPLVYELVKADDIIYFVDQYLPNIHTCSQGYPLAVREIHLFKQKRSETGCRCQREGYS